MSSFKITILAAVFCSSLAIAQETVQSTETPMAAERREQAITVGILQGGGSLLGVDYERMVGGNLGLQIGAGFVGFGAAANWHFLPTAKSSAVSLQFWNQGTSGDKLSQQVAGVTYLYRSETNGLTGQIGLGYVVTTGKLMADYYKDKNIANPPKVILLYSIGWCFY